MKKSTRQYAFDVLLRIERDKAYSNIVLSDALAGINDDRDVAFTSALVNGVIERLFTLDGVLSANLRQSLKRLKPQVLIILRIGAYQLLFMDKIPSSAAVNESVKLAKDNGCAYASGLINAVLRNVSSAGITYPSEEDDFYEYCRVRYSFPTHIAAILVDTLGRDAAQDYMLSTFSTPATLCRLNNLTYTKDELEATLSLQNVEADFDGFADNRFRLATACDLACLAAFRKGMFIVQDTSSSLCCDALGAMPGETVADVCAAPGGKTMRIAMDMKNCGRLMSFDIHQKRVDIIRRTASRLGLSVVEASCRDASDKNAALPECDRILCDVPCSGLGVISRKPEIKYKTDESFSELPELQYSILDASSRYVKQNGRLVYSTCTINNAENRDVCNRFLACHPEFEKIHVLPDIDRTDDYITLLPSVNGCDGFFIAAFRRKSDAEN